MNNSLSFEIEDPFNIEPELPVESLREREAKLVRIIQAVLGLSQSQEWRTLKEQLFDEIGESIEKRLRAESTKEKLHTEEIYRLQGEYRWARRYADPVSLAKTYQDELSAIRKLLNPPGGAG